MTLLTESFPEAAKGRALVVFEADEGETLADAPRRDRRRHSTTSPLSTTSSGLRPVRGRHRLGRRHRSGTPRSPSTCPSARWASPPSPSSRMRCPAWARRGSGSSSAATPCSSTPRTSSSSHVGVGLLVALVVLLVVFGTLVAAVLPIGLSLVAVGAGIGAITLLAGSHGRLRLRHPGRGPRRARRRRRLRAVRRSPRYRENRHAGQDNQPPSPRRWAPPARPSCSRAAPS